MPLVQAYELPKTKPLDDVSVFQIAIAGQAHPTNSLHSGGFATTGKAWAILAAPFVDDPCNGEGPEGCEQAMALRALKEALDRRTLPTEQFTLLTTSVDLAVLLFGWQYGHSDMPTWYQRRGNRATLVRVQRQVHRIGERMQVQHVTPDKLPPVGEAANAMMHIGMRYLRGQISAADQYHEGQLAMREAGL